MTELAEPFEMSMPADMVLSTGMKRGAAISYDRLEDLLARLQS